MLTVNKRIPAGSALATDWDVRQNSRFDATDSQGRALCALLPRGTAVRGAHVLAYPRLLAFAPGPVGKAFLFAVIMLFAWHAAHRILCSLHDVGIHKGLMAKSICYGAALVVSLVAAGALLRIGF